MNFIFHIGTHKTGSTAIQNFLLANRNRLLNSGILYPSVGLKDTAHHNLAWTLKAGDINKTKDLCLKIEQEATYYGVDTVVLSSEEFEFVRNINTLKNFFSEISNAQIILYIRRPDLYLESEYKQHVKMYKIRYKYDIYKFYYGIDFQTRFNYRLISSLWNQFTDVKVINYDHCLCEQYGLFKYLLANIGISWDDDFLMPDNKGSNISPSNLGSIYLARLNRLNLSSSSHKVAHRIITEQFESAPDRPLLSHEDKLILWRRFKGPNDWVAKQYGIEPFQKPSLDDEPIDFHSDFDEKLFSAILNRIMA